MENQAKIKIESTEFFRSGMIYAECKVNGDLLSLIITADTKDFDKFAPKDFEGTLQDGEGEYCAWFDDFENLHWLIKLTTGHIAYRTVPCTALIEQLAYEKYTL